MQYKDLDKTQAGKIFLSSQSRYLLMPSWLVTSVVVLYFLLPHISLRFSYLPIVSFIYSSFVLFVFFSISYVVLIKLSIRKYVASVLMIFTIAAAYGETMGLYYGRSFFEVTKSTYEALAAIFIFLLILLSGITTRSLTRAVVNPFLWVVFFDALYSIYQYLFVASYKELWFYEPLTNMGNELNSWNYEVTHGLFGGNYNGSSVVIRAPGIFTSPLENTYVISLACIYFFLKAIKTNTIYALPALFYVLVGYMTGVRTFFIGVFIVFWAWVVIETSRKIRPFFLFIIMPFAGILMTYQYLSVQGDAIDRSAAGRIDQLINIFDLMVNNPLGYGFGSVGIGKDYLFDSAYATWFVSLGVLGGGIIIYIYYWLSKQLVGCLTIAIERDDMIFLLTLVLFSIDLAYISQFQYALITPGRWYYVIAAGIVLNRLRMDKQESYLYVTKH